MSGMRKLNIPVGTIVGRLTVVSRAESSPHGQQMFLCKCECGKTVTVSATHLKHSAVRSCGCLALDHAAQMNRKHGAYRTRMYSTWLAMRSRCSWSGHPSYKNYGARGITVCKAWNTFETFRKWAMSNGYSDDLTIDRIDNGKGYCPSNCRWVSRAAQAKNLRKTVWVDTDVGRMCLAEAARHYGVVSAKTAHSRIRKRKWDPLRAVSEPKKG